MPELRCSVEKLQLLCNAALGSYNYIIIVLELEMFCNTDSFVMNNLTITSDWSSFIYITDSISNKAWWYGPPPPSTFGYYQQPKWIPWNIFQ